MRANIVVMLLAMLPAGWGTPPSAVAQSPLERLERQIRQRVEGAEGVQPEPEANNRPAAPAPQAQTPPRGGNVTPGYLGVVIDDRKDRGRGVRILEVEPGSPAEKAGLRRQDLIIGLGGIRVRQMSDLSEILDTFGPGQGVEFEVLRDGQRQRVRAVLGQRPAAAPRRSEGPEVVPLPRGEAIPPPPEPQPAGPQLQPPEPSRIDRLERRVEQLERRVDELERELKTIKKECHVKMTEH